MRFGLVVFMTTILTVVLPAGASGQAFGYDDAIDRVGVITDAKALATITESLPGRPAVGFKYTQLLVVVPVWTWGGEYCVYARDRYVVIPQAMAAVLLGVPEAQLQTPFFYRFPFGLVVCPAIAVVGGPVSYLLYRRRERARQRVEALSASLIGVELPPTKPPRSFLSD